MRGGRSGRASWARWTVRRTNTRNQRKGAFPVKDLFTNLNNAVAGAAAPIACNHNHALVHNPFAWSEPKPDAKSEK
jgi:hypothetical protein